MMQTVRKQIMKQFTTPLEMYETGTNNERTLAEADERLFETPSVSIKGP